MQGLLKTSTVLPLVYSGRFKVSNYAVGDDKLLIVATDRISVGDIHPVGFDSLQGQVLTQLLNTG